ASGREPAPDWRRRALCYWPGSSFRDLLTHRYNDPKTDAGGAGRGIEGLTAGSPAGPAIAGPGPAAYNTTQSVILISILVVLVVPILTPLKHVAVHVMESPGIRLVTAHLRRALEVRPLGRVAVGLLAVEICL